MRLEGRAVVHICHGALAGVACRLRRVGQRGPGSARLGNAAGPNVAVSSPWWNACRCAIPPPDDTVCLVPIRETVLSLITSGPVRSER